jgi:hypothetical protein
MLIFIAMGGLVAGAALEYFWLRKLYPALGRWADSIKPSDIPPEWRQRTLT